MFQSNARTEKFNGLRFYEQDVVYDDYVFAGNIQVTIDVDYISPGIGIALIDSDGVSIREKNECYLFRLGFKEASVIYRLGDDVKTNATKMCDIAPYKENMRMVFSKSSRRITVEVDGYGIILDYMLPKQFDKYNVGIYSNAGNMVKNISIASSIPENWSVNMKNTNGGYIRFTKNAFSIESCQAPAEIEQYGITLKAGTYYFSYENENVYDINDITGYVFMSDDTRPYDDEKNILGNGTFTLATDGSVNVKFKGTNGTIKNIHISDTKSDKYVPSDDDQIASIQGSHIDIELTELKQIKWTGIITDTPDEYSNDTKDTFSIISDDKDNVSLIEANVIKNMKYDYVYDVDTSQLSISNGKKITMQYVSKSVSIFKNINAIITEFSLIPRTGQVINLIAEKTVKRYIQDTITSPIIVVDVDNIPLDLSASFRIINEDGHDMYVFTNVEREVFEPQQYIVTEKKISKEPGAVKVYGILNNATVNYDNILRISRRGLDTVDMFADKYDTIYESDLYAIDKISSKIFMHDISEYKLLVVDYLKDDSYCINHVDDQYEVDISTTKQNVSILYDHSDGSNSIVVSDYRVTDIIPQQNCYIVLRKEEFAS